MWKWKYTKMWKGARGTTCINTIYQDKNKTTSLQFESESTQKYGREACVITINQENSAFSYSKLSIWKSEST